MKNKSKIITAASITALLLLIVSISFAALATNLNINFGRVTQNALSWNIGFKGNSVTSTTEGTGTEGLSCGTASITPSTVTVSNTTLSKPGDRCIYPLTISNNGDIPSILQNISATAPTSTSCTINGATMECGNITYRLTTTSEDSLTTGITINKSEEYNIKLIVSYTGTSVSGASSTQNGAKFTLTYVQAAKRSGDDPVGIVKPPVCRRATTLHTETCTKTSSEFYCSGSGYTASGSHGTTTITYGNLGTPGTLNSGDAFDCDVNGDGDYDATTERFYYLSQVDNDDSNQYAALIYYSNVQRGNPIRKYTSDYGYNRKTTQGPIVAYRELPTTTQWPNVTLSNDGKRQIYTVKNTTVVNTGYDNPMELPVFEYTGRAARMPSHKELSKACNLSLGITDGWGAFKNCEYILERGGFDNGEWNDNWLIESVGDYSDEDMVFIDSMTGNAGSTNGGFGIRPVIEVPLTNIQY